MTMFFSYPSFYFSVIFISVYAYSYKFLKIDSSSFNPNFIYKNSVYFGNQNINSLKRTITSTCIHLNIFHLISNIINLVFMEHVIFYFGFKKTDSIILFVSSILMTFLLTENIPKVTKLLKIYYPSLQPTKNYTVGASIIIYSYIGFITIVAYTQINKKELHGSLNNIDIYLMLASFVLGIIEISFYLYKKITNKKTFIEILFGVNISFIGHSVGYVSGILIGLIYIAFNRIIN